MKKIVLSPEHQRSLSAVARSIENSLNDITAILDTSHTEHLLHHIVPSYTKSERAEILTVVNELRKGLKELIQTFNLSSYAVTERQIVNAQCAHLWILLQDSKSNKLKRYGDVPLESGGELDRIIDDLLRLVNKLKDAGTTTA
jgi:bifunctional N-acetylglucosamine-1-phosphate-uridyltransferase/glucosamine-1-phosphate-acetyltransferase GlmU-like protein